MLQSLIRNEKLDALPLSGIISDRVGEVDVLDRDSRAHVLDRIKGQTNWQ